MMTLDSTLFLFLFLPIFILAFIISNQEYRFPLVLIASLIFLVVQQPVALIWLSVVLLIGYVLGRLISTTDKSTNQRRLFLWVGIVLIIFLLLTFKYLLAFGIEGLYWMKMPRVWRTSVSSIMLSVGFSYATFQIISYLVDVWKGMIPPEKNILRLAAYVFFFPKLVSGPIVRYKFFSDQIAHMAPTSENIIRGIRRILIGFTKRILIANLLAPTVNAAFSLDTPNFSPRVSWLILAAYSLQIFFDFSGFMDMALGLGIIMGIRLPENFNAPYTAESISDFWRRWHITLTTWFREYIFYPLERRRVKFAGQQINILIVFLLTGLWHGLNPTFIVWGLLHGIAMAIESAGFGRFLKKIWRPIRHVYTLAIVLSGWIFFRSPTLAYAFQFISRLFGNRSGITPLPFSKTTPLPFIEPSFLLALALGVLLCLPISTIWNKFREKIEEKSPALFFLFQPIEDILLIALFILGLAAILSNGFAPNIYAKF